jgi:Cu(I)/Ag(I) efflux system membrane fusion protein
MDLTPVTRGELESGMIRVDEKQRQLIGVKTAPIERQPAELAVRAVGRVTYDETRLADVTLKLQGWVGEVFADATGMPVKEGEPLFTVYAPELLSAQEEFLESARRARTDTRPTSRLLQNARQRLLLWNLTESQVAELARAGKSSVHLPIHSPVGGIVIEKNIVAGSALAPGQRLYRIADLSHVWVEADVYEADLPLVRVGDPATVTLSYLPGETFAGTIDYVYPYLDAPTRTGRARIVVPNPDGALKPDMYADVELAVSLGEQVLVPVDAVIRAGKTNVAFVDLGEGRLKPRTLELGRRTADGYVVRSGLEPGEVVVTSGNFLIAAESKLKAGLDKW